MSELTGGVALVTGGGRGLGRAFAVALAEAGMSVAILARSSDQLAETESLMRQSGAKTLSLAADVTNPAGVQTAMARVEEALGPLDLLVNNAGVAGPCGPVDEIDASDWWRCVETNLYGAFLCSHSALPSMKERKRGRIVNVASLAGGFAIPYLSAYVASKAALIRFTETLALEIAPFGLSTFAIHPGTVRTAMSEALLNSEAARSRIPWFEWTFQHGQDVPTDEAVGLLLFLARGSADRLSGRLFLVPEDPAKIVSRAREIESEDLYTLRLRGLS
jgi:NAD(P)-dependent dehydrogenase (short-subunit alcohol dehydrogenase family)